MVRELVKRLVPGVAALGVVAVTGGVPTLVGAAILVAGTAAAAWGLDKLLQKAWKE